MQYRILGPLAVTKDGAEVVVGSGKQRALLALLLLHANEAVSTDRLIDQLWGGSRATSATKVLHNYVSKLRRLLGEGVLITRGHAYELRVESGELDLDRFNDQVADGRQALAAGDPARAAAALGAALALWHGPPLADFAYDQFALAEIERLDGLRLAALIERIEADLQLGRHSALIGELETPRRCSIRFRSGCAASSCSRSTAPGARPRRSRSTRPRDGHSSRSSGSSRARSCSASNARS